MSNSKSFFNLYTNSVKDFCNNQSKIIEYVEKYISLKDGNMLEEDIITLYIEIADDDEWSFTREEEHGSKRNYVEHQLLILINRYRFLVQKELNVSFKRLDVLLGLLS